VFSSIFCVIFLQLKKITDFSINPIYSRCPILNDAAISSQNSILEKKISNKIGLVQRGIYDAAIDLALDNHWRSHEGDLYIEKSI